MASIILIVAMFALLWLLLIRPQRAKQRTQQQMMESIAPGDEILTAGGLYGIVSEIDEDDDLVVEVAEGIRVRIARRAVATVVKPEEDEGPEAETVKDEALAADEGEAHVTAPPAGEAVGGDEETVKKDEETVRA